MFYKTSDKMNMPLFNVQLLTRVCPPLHNGGPPQDPYFLVDPMQGIIMFGNNRVFKTENVLPMHCPQDVLFDRYLQPTIDASFEGYNVSVVAFGQSGAGKTYTLFGPGLLYTMNESNFGVLPRALRHIFQKIQHYTDRRFSIQASFLEIFGEEIHDLFSLEPFHSDIGIKENPNGEVEVVGATKVECLTIEDVFNCLETGLALRHSPSMDPRAVSSHGIFTLFLKQYCVQDGYLLEIQSKLQFVDLAASDNLSLANNNPLTGPYLDAVPINSGLLALSNVTAALGDPRRKASHIPYWDSKLTSLLKDSFGGNSLTVFVACISSSNADLQGCVNTLQFASRVTNIMNSPVPNLRVLQFNQNPIHETDQNDKPVAESPTKDSSSQNVKLSKLSDEVFKLRFAVSQWQLLVTNAESLLTDLSTSELLSKDVQHKIMSWLCMKEEFAHCIDIEEANAVNNSVNESISQKSTSDLRPSLECVFEEDTVKGLHVIEEVSEPTPTCESDSSDALDDDSDASSSDGSDDAEKLDALRQKFREATDVLIDDIEAIFDNIGTCSANERPDAAKQSARPPSTSRSLRFQFDETASLPSSTSTLVPANKSVSGSSGSRVNFAEHAEVRLQRKISSSTDTDIRSDSDSELTEDARKRLDERTARRKTDKNNESSQLRRSKERRQKTRVRSRSSKLHPYQSWPHAHYQVKPIEKRGLTFKSNEEKNFISTDTMNDVDNPCNQSSRADSASSAGKDRKCSSLGTVKTVVGSGSIIEHDEEVRSKTGSAGILVKRKSSERLLSSSVVLESLIHDKSVQTSLRSLHTCQFGTNCSAFDIVDQETDIVRKDIRKMRQTRDLLVERRQELDEKTHRGIELSASEERRMLELDEAIEAIDVAIEFKNEVLCSQVEEIRLEPEVLVAQLLSLTHRETRSLLCKYFRKVVDLREGAKKMEQQYAELEAQYDDLTTYARKLSAALKHVQLRMDRRQVNEHADYASRTHQASKHRMAAHSYAIEEDATTRRIREEHEMMERRSRELRKHLRDLLATSGKPKSQENEEHKTPADEPKASVSEASVPASGSRMPSLRGLQAVQALHQKITGLHRLRNRPTNPETTTTVTREKNKLIIKRQPVQGEEKERRRYK